MSAIPTGSFAPDSPSRMVPERPRISRLPKTENVTAGSVGASAAPIRPASVQPRPSSQWPTAASIAAVANVPTMPSPRIGPADCRKRRRPMWRPPSKRMMIRATVVIRSTSTIESAFPSESDTSAAIGGRTRKSAAAGSAKRDVSERSEIATKSATATTSTMTAKSKVSVTSRTLRTPAAASPGGALTVSLRATHHRLIADPDT